MRYPLELGPRVSIVLLVYRYIANGLILLYSLPKVAGAAGVSNVLTVRLGLTIYCVSFALSSFGFFFFISNMNPKFEKKRLWWSQTGKMHCREMWYSPIIYKAEFTNKDEERFSWFFTLHCNYLPADIIEKWLCEDLIALYGADAVAGKRRGNGDGSSRAEGAASGGMGGDSESWTCPPWLDDAFKRRATAMFIFYGVDEATKMRVEEAMEELPTYDANIDVIAKDAVTEVEESKSSKKGKKNENDSVNTASGSAYDGRPKSNKVVPV